MTDAVPTGVATGVGSLPGTDIDSALAMVFDALPDLPHLPELPARGPGADLVGRTAAALVDLHVDLQPAGWRLVSRGGIDEQRATDLLERDLDALVPVAPGYDGLFKVQICGPLTLAATVELPRGGKALGDAGAVRDLVAALAETVRAHLADVRRRLPAARLVLQLDEPALPAALAGRIPTASGLGRLRAIDPTDAATALRTVLSAVGEPTVVHCCDRDVPLALLHDAGAGGVSVDLAVARLDLDEVGERVEQGLVLWLGAVPALGPGVPPTARELLDPVRELWRRLALPADLLVQRIALTPACGLAGASDGWSHTALRLLTQAARALVEAPEGLRR
ncbi:MAG TPA: methionine synthase [Mycobacteriales bacterium]|nr:methionine synthase [Mycobacteriales bacterium]